MAQGVEDPRPLQVVNQGFGEVGGGTAEGWLPVGSANEPVMLSDSRLPAFVLVTRTSLLSSSV
ncbi:MAG TPA: hypothetical protein VKO35_09170 [Acidimicrobiia bacterium]|nr:hypothetical protein [Acidimicrobiia bacterium]